MRIPRRTWLSIAAVALVFSFVVLVVMLATWAKPLGENPLDTNEWQTLKDQLAGHPGDSAEADRVRALDLNLRRQFFRRRDRIRTGGTLLLIGLVVALVAVKRFNRRVYPEPDQPVDAPVAAEWDRRTAHARTATLVGGLLLAGGAAYLWLVVPAGIARPAPTPVASGEAKAEAAAPTPEEIAKQWTSFRGHEGSGISPFSDVPRSWDGTTGENILWKTPLPLPGANSPIVFGDRIFLTGADARREEVYCIDAKTGSMLWKKALVVAGRRGDPPEPMADTGYAAPTAATDGRRVFAMFASGRVAAFDFEGKQLWLKSFGPFENSYGHSSSLVVHGDRLILQIDQGYADDPVARLVALDTATGDEVWSTKREVDSSWASPIVASTPSGPQVILSASPIVAAYDPATGRMIWSAEVMGGEVAPSPICRDGVVYVTQQDIGTFAILSNGNGDVTETHVLWESMEFAPDVTSPICDGERLYLLATGGTLTCIRAADGETVYQRELETGFYASPSLAGDVLFLTDMKGVTHAIRAGDEFEELGPSPLGEGVVASMAFAPGRIYLRGDKHLFAIGGGR